MAGKFLTLEEAAHRLGVPVEEVNRLVDRKELFPMRDGTTIKFKVDEIERVAADLAAGGSGQGSGLSLDLDLEGVSGGSGPGSAAGSAAGDLIFPDSSDDDSIFGDDLLESPQTPAAAIPEGAAPPSGTFDVDDIGLDSILAASSPGLGGAGGPAAGGSGLDFGSGTIELDLGDASLGGSAGDSGGLAIDLSDIGGGGSPASGPGLPGSGISGALDSGLSLEKDTFEVSGIDLDEGSGPAAAGSGVDAFGSGIGGEAFDLGGDATGLDDDGSVFVSPDESGDSSFLTSAMEDASSSSFETGSEGVPFAAPSLENLELAAEPEFSLWQVAGLICCSLLMLIGGLLVFDIVQTAQSGQGKPVSSPILDGLAGIFGW